MKILIKLLKSRRILIVFGFILLVLLIMVGGARLGLPLNSRLLGLVILLFIGILYFQFKQTKANRGAAMLEQSIKDQADEQKLALRPEKQEEIEALKRELTSSIESLKRSKLGKGRRGRAALYALPWYMFIGPPAAGKTTAIINSGLEFPSGSDIKGIGGTRNCDWFFSNSAILLDTAGRYTTEKEDREEWHAFLDILKKYRSRQPINGVIVGMSIADILNASSDEVDWHAKNIRNRIDELVKRLDTRFPVYLVFTKCDLIQGFVELFENLSRKDREQVWGCTFSQEQQNAANPREIFEKEFRILLQSLNDFRLQRFSSAVKPELRNNVYVFPLEFATICDKVSNFIGKMFQPNPYHESPFFRGFYFTSGTQEGVPIDQVIHAIAQQFDLPPDVISEPQIEKKSYFIKRLFTDIIIPDQNMVVQTSKAAVNKNIVRIAALAGSVIALGLFILGVSLAYVDSTSNLSRIKGTAKKMLDVRWGRDAILASNFKNMDRLRERLTKLEDNSTHRRLISSVGMYRGSSLLKPARSMYHRKLNAFVNAHLYQVLDRRLRDYMNRTSFPLGKIIKHLKAYLLMGSEIERIGEPDNEDFLRRELNSILAETYSSLLPQDEFEELRLLIERQLDFFVTNLGKTEGMQPFDNELDLIESVRDRIMLYEKPSIEGVYELIKSDARIRNLIPFSLSSALDTTRKTIFLSDYEVPGLFTKDGWEGYVRDAIELESHNPGKEAWVLGGEEQAFSEDMRDPDRMRMRLISLYYQDYSQYWVEFLHSIHFPAFGNLTSASNNLKTLGDPSKSPLIPFLNSVTEQTRFISPVQPAEEKGLTKSIKKVTGKLIKRKPEAVPQQTSSQYEIDLQFRALHSLSTSPTEGIPEKLSNILNQYVALHSMLESMSSDPGIQAKDYAAAILQQGTGELPEALRQIRLVLNELDITTRRCLFEQPVKNTWAAILDEAQEYLNMLWKAQIYDEFQRTLARYYPFNAAGQDVSIADVKRFLDPSEGSLWLFIDTELKPFIKPESWSSNTWEEHGIRFSADFVNVMKRADNIKKAFFQGGFPIHFRMQPDLPTVVSGSVPPIEQIYIYIDGIDDAYQMGMRRFKEFGWPGSGGTPGARLKILMRDKSAEPAPIQYDGEWAWFRLLEEAQVESEGSSMKFFNIHWIFNHEGRFQVRVNYKLQALSEDNPFYEVKNLFRFSFPGRLN